VSQQKPSNQHEPSGPKSDAVAVALRYERGLDAAPRVVASGRGHIAERIVELAFQSGVRVREDADLAEALVAVEIGDVIPVAAFAAVAEILIYIYRANRGQGNRPAGAAEASAAGMSGDAPSTGPTQGGAA
jgi:flagellar biosynthesis protein